MARLYGIGNTVGGDHSAGAYRSASGTRAVRGSVYGQGLQRGVSVAHVRFGARAPVQARGGVATRSSRLQVDVIRLQEEKEERRSMSMAKGRELGGHMREECGTGSQCRQACDGKARVSCG